VVVCRSPLCWKRCCVTRCCRRRTGRGATRRKVPVFSLTRLAACPDSPLPLLFPTLSLPLLRCSDADLLNAQALAALPGVEYAYVGHKTLAPALADPTDGGSLAACRGANQLTADVIRSGGGSAGGSVSAVRSAAPRRSARVVPLLLRLRRGAQVSTILHVGMESKRLLFQLFGIVALPCCMRRRREKR
jgi:hypothetical protein